MDSNRRAQAIECLRKHGYRDFTDDLDRARITKEESKFDERIAVHWEQNAYVLYVRRGGAKYLDAIQAEIGGTRKSDDPNALGFSNLDLETLDNTLGKVLSWLQKNPKR